MYAIITLIIFLWIPVTIIIIRNILHDTYLWQIKEYRVDRIISHLRFKEYKSYRSRLINFIQYGLLISGFLFFINPLNILLMIPALAFFTYLVEAMDITDQIKLRELVRPKKSIRNFLIIGFSFFVLFSSILLPLNFVRNVYIDNNLDFATIEIDQKEAGLKDFLIQTTQNELTDEEVTTIPLVILVLMVTTILALAADFASPAVVSIFAITTEPLAQYKRRRLISAAKNKAASHSNLNENFKVVAITGSYGKTTTKEFLYEIIKDNYKTAKTRENYNSPVGVAQEILRNLKKDTEVFIAEMGAYRKGEITQSTNIIKPDITIVTAVGPQHVSLFGSTSKIYEAKYEIVRALDNNGVAILNGNNDYCMRMKGDTDKNTFVYYQIEDDLYDDVTDKDNSTNKKLPENTIYAIGIKEDSKNGGTYTFEIEYEKKSYDVEVKIGGRHNVSNLLAAISAALNLGMDFKSIIAKLKFIDFPEIHLKWKEGLNETQILDDSYNSNPEGFKSALSEVSKAAKKSGENAKRILITKGIIELGKEKKGVYKDLAKKIGANIDIALVSDDELIKAIKTEEVVKTQIIKIRTDLDFYRYYLSHAKQGDFVLIEGRIAPKIYDKLLDTKLP